MPYVPKSQRGKKVAEEGKKQKYTVIGHVEIEVSTEVEASSALEALRIAHRNRGGAQDLDWKEGDWGSDVISISVVDPEDWKKVLAGEADISEYMRKKY